MLEEIILKLTLKEWRDYVEAAAEKENNNKYSQAKDECNKLLEFANQLIREYDSEKIRFRFKQQFINETFR